MFALTDRIREVWPVSDEDAGSIGRLLNLRYGADLPAGELFPIAVREAARVLASAKDEAVEVEFAVSEYQSQHIDIWEITTHPLIFEAAASCHFRTGYVKLVGQKEVVREMAVKHMGYDPEEADAVIEGREYVPLEQEELDKVIEADDDSDDGGDFECQCCGRLWHEENLNPVQDLLQRVDPGEPLPAGECPVCGAVCHQIEEQSDQ